MTHEWKIGDWCEHNEQRKFIYDVNDKAIYYVTYGGNTDYFYPSTLGVKHLPDCTGWDWQPPKPIEPPEGYRLIEEGVVVGGDLCLTAGWRESERVGDCIEYLLKNGFAKAYARKIEPQYRPMTRPEFLAAWRQRNFCPLIASNGTIETVDCVVPDIGDDKQLVFLGNNGWQTFDSLAKNYSFLYGEEPYAPVSVEA